MSLFLSKLLTQLVYPLNLALLAAAVGIPLAAWRYRRLGLSLLAAALLWLWVWSMPLMRDWLVATLEQHHRPVAAEMLPRADAIVVLGGGIDAVTPPRLYPNLAEASDRVWHAARLYRAGKAERILLSGGDLPWLGASTSEADAMATLLHDLGVPEAALLREGDSRTTYENAIHSRRILEKQGLHSVLLVTSAFHMPRALATFRAAGIAATPAATDYRVVTRPTSTALDLLPDADALLESSQALKEYLGIVVYRLRGWLGP